MIFGRSFRLIAVALVWAIAGMTQLSAQDASGDEVLATIGSSRITVAEVEQIMAGRPELYAGLPPGERREKVLETLVAEYLIDYFYGQDLSRLSAPVLDSLSDARRQVLFQIFAQTQFEPPEVTDSDVRAYIDANPELFVDRNQFRFMEVGLPAGVSSADEAALLEAVGRGGPSVAVMNDAVAALNARGIAATFDTQWLPSEAIRGDTRDALGRMAAEDRAIDLDETAAGKRLLVLFEAVPLPADPAVLDARIRTLIVQEAFQDHLQNLRTRLASSVLVGADAATADGGAPIVQPPPRGTVVWSPSPVLPREVRLAGLFTAGFLALLTLYATVAWVALVRGQHPELRKQEPVMPVLKRTGVSVGLAGVVILSIVGLAALCISVSVATFGYRATGVLLIGAAVLGGAVAWVWHAKARRRRDLAHEEYAEMFSDEGMIRSAALLSQSSYPLLVAAIFLLIATSASAAVLLDLPLGLR